ncbi:MAG: hypothetical protein DSY82_04765, partial [Flavobacteriia bacterium]
MAGQNFKRLKIKIYLLDLTKIFSMKSIFKYFLFLTMLQFVSSCGQQAPDQIDLSGEWNFKMDPQDQGVSQKWFESDFSEKTHLPGSMTENSKGNPVG